VLKERSITQNERAQHRMSYSKPLVPTIEKLMGRNNCSISKFDMEMFVVTDDLWDLVTGNKINVKNDAKSMS
jgi:hypothetical protein